MKILKQAKYIFLFLIFLIPAAYSNNDYEILDKIIVIVEKEVITQKELQNQIKKIEIPLNASKGEILKKALDLLIEKKIIIQYANLIEINVGQEEINYLLSNILQQNSITLDELVEDLDKNNSSIEDFKNDLQYNLYLKKIKEREIMPYVQVTENEVESWLNKRKSEEDVEYQIFHILIKNDNPKKNDKLKKILEQLRTKNFKDVAKDLSEGPFSENGGDLGWKNIKELPDIFANNIIQMKKDEIISFESSNGIHILKLSDIRNNLETEKVFISQYKFQEIFLKKNVILSDDDLENKLVAIKNQILSGFNFDEAIKKFSDNKLQENSNNLEWVGLDNFISDFRKQFENYPRENLIGPFKTELGWHIIKIYDYRKKDISDDVNRNNAKISIVQFKTELRFKDWLNALVEGSKIQYLEKIF